MPATSPCAAERVLAALADNQGATSKMLASYATVGQSTASKQLATFEKLGVVVRKEQAPDLLNGRREPSRWYTIDGVPDSEPEPAEATPAEVEESSEDVSEEEGDTGDRVAVDGERQSTEVADAGPAEQPAAEAKPTRVLRTDRLAKGDLRGLVERWLDEHPAEEFTPSQLGKLLDRSPGAIVNALQKLIEFGAAVQTSDKPRTYQATEA
jgi:predicted transcriptional regulator